MAAAASPSTRVSGPGDVAGSGCPSGCPIRRSSRVGAAHFAVAVSIFRPVLGSAVDTIPLSPAEAADRIRREPRCFVTRQPDHGEIARYAYELFLSRGAEDGRDLQDWLEAERHLTKTPQRRMKNPAAPSRRRR